MNHQEKIRWQWLFGMSLLEQLEDKEFNVIILRDIFGYEFKQIGQKYQLHQQSIRRTYLRSKIALIYKYHGILEAIPYLEKLDNSEKHKIKQ